MLDINIHFSGSSQLSKKSGQSLWPEWTDDPASSNFINSLAFQCEKGTPNYMAFMTSAGMCMTSCSADDQAAFKTEFQQACQWYTSHSNDTCSGSSSNSSSASSTTATSGSVNLQISDLVTVCAIVVGLGLL